MLLQCVNVRQFIHKHFEPYSTRYGLEYLLSYTGTYYLPSASQQPGYLPGLSVPIGDRDNSNGLACSANRILRLRAQAPLMRWLASRFNRPFHCAIL
jgi:hypothetical protein